MSAEVLRRAAEKMRAGEGSGDEILATLSFVADWLDEVAERQDPTERYGRRSHGWTGSREANAVARAYLGETA